jgi:hypothetical protein
MNCITDQTNGNTMRRAKFVPESPVHVIDFSSCVDLDIPKTCTGHLNLNAPDLRRSPLRCALTILEGETEALSTDSITAPCSTTTDDENDASSVVSSISSHSCCDHDVDKDNNGTTPNDGAREWNREELRRSIFSHYWRTTGQEPLELIREHSKMTRSTSNPRLSSLVPEENPRMPSSLQTSDSPATPTRRRSIFGGMDRSVGYSSLRSLPELNCTPSHSQIECGRKIRSISCLRSSEPLVSCLRKSSFDSSCKRRERLPSSSSSVSFDAKIQVVTYQTPLENWSDGSWSKLFGME